MIKFLIANGKEAQEGDRLYCVGEFGGANSMSQVQVLYPDRTLVCCISDKTGKEVRLMPERLFKTPVEGNSFIIQCLEGQVAYRAQMLDMAKDELASYKKDIGRA